MNSKIVAAASIAGLAGLANAQVINEFQPNPASVDPATTAVEIRGVAGESFSGVIYTIDTDFFPGSIDRESAVSGTFDANGLLVVNIPDLENPSFDILLASNAGLVGQNADEVNFGTIYDAIGIIDAAGDAANSFAASFGGTLVDFTGDEPGLVFRDGLNPGTIYAINDPSGGLAFDQFGNSFDLATDFFTIDGISVDLSGFNSSGLLTEGGVNYTTVPAPAAFAAFGIAGLATTRRRR